MQVNKKQIETSDRVRRESAALIAHSMARAQVLLAAAALLLLSSGFCTAQTSDTAALAAQINAVLDQQAAAAASAKAATVAATKPTATSTRISQLRDPTLNSPSGTADLCTCSL